MGRGRTRTVKKPESLGAPSSSDLVEIEEQSPETTPAPGMIVVILRDAHHYVVAGQRFEKNVPKQVDSRMASLFRSKGWFEVIG